LIGWGADMSRVGELIEAASAAGIAHATITSDDLVQIAAIENA
jgi:hypothetical protein